MEGERDAEAGSPGLELIAKVDSVITALERHSEISAAELAIVLDEPLSSTYRMLQSLTAIGWIDRGPRRGSYRLGLRLMTIGGLIEDSIDVRGAPFRTCGLCFTTLELPASCACVATPGRSAWNAWKVSRSAPWRCDWAVRSPCTPGPRLARCWPFCLPSEQRAVLRSNDRLPGDPAQPDRADLEKDLAVVKKKGYAVSDGDVTPGVAALGAPVFNHRHELVAAISISGLRAQILGAQRRRNVRLIVAAARGVSAALGDEPGAR